MRAVLFDLDGVIVSTDEFHYQAWKSIADEEKIPFDRGVNDRLRGVSRMESLEILLERAAKPYSEAEKQELAEKKNGRYRDMLQSLTPNDILPGITALLNWLKSERIKTAVASSSRNAVLILEKIGLNNAFDAVVDGNQIARSKPDPEVFALAAKKLRLNAGECLVVEDADAGVKAAIAAGMRVVGLGPAATGADFNAPSTLDLQAVLKGIFAS